VTDYAIYMLDPNGIVTSWNPGAQRFKGYTASEIIGQHFSRFYSETDRNDGLPARALETARREGKFESEGWRIRKDGTQFWAYVIIDPIRSPDGTVVGTDPPAGSMVDPKSDVTVFVADSTSTTPCP